MLIFNKQLSVCPITTHLPLKFVSKKITKKELTLNNDLSKPDLPTALSLDCSKAKSEINWTNNTDFEEALKITFNWALENLNE